MARKGASAGRGLSDDGRLWGEEIARSAFDDFDFPRHRITGGKGRTKTGNGRMPATGAENGGNGRMTTGNGTTNGGNARMTNGNGYTNSANARTTPNGAANGASGRVTANRNASGSGRMTIANGRTHGAGGSTNGGNGRLIAAPGSTRSEPGRGVPGRRTVTIRGYGAERNLPWTAGQSRRRPAEPRHQRPGFRADRAAMWAVLLGIMLVIVAAASSHAAVLRGSASASHMRAGAAVSSRIAPAPSRAARPRFRAHP
jgi:hypothetical protein